MTAARARGSKKPRWMKPMPPELVQERRAKAERLVWYRHVDRAEDAWEAFVAELTEVLRGLENEQYMVLRRMGKHYFVQFMCQGEAGMRAEAVSNNYISHDEGRLTPYQVEVLKVLGWRAPDLPVEDPSEPHEREGSPNYYLDVPNPVSYHRLARLAADSLMIAYNTGHPRALEYVAAGATGQRVRMAIRSVRRAARQ